MKAFYAMALGALLALLSCASRETVSPEFSVEYNAQATQPPWRQRKGNACG